MRYLLTITLCMLLYAASIGPVWGAWQRGYISDETWNRLACGVYWPLHRSDGSWTLHRPGGTGAIWIDGPLADYLEWWD